MKKLPKFKHLIEEILPNDCIGTNNTFTHKGKLTAYFFNHKKITNYIPSKMFSPIELIHYSSHFKNLLKSQSNIKTKYFSPFKQITDNMRMRKDMFNMFLKKNNKV